MDPQETNIFQKEVSIFFWNFVLEQSSHSFLLYFNSTFKFHKGHFKYFPDELIASMQMMPKADKN